MRKPSNVIALAAVLALAACGSTSSAATAPMRHVLSPPAAVASPSPSNPPAVETTEVTISNFEYHPASIRVKQGSTVTWKQEDTDVHNVKFTSPGGVVSPLLRKGDSYSHTFNTTGTYPYICSIHPYMHGTVVVTT